jgi:hypothetical protein
VCNDSTRMKLFLTKRRIENHSDCSDAYVRIFNKSLKSNYTLWLTIEKHIANAWVKLFGGFRLLDPIRWLGRFVISFYGRYYEKNDSM